MKGAGCICQWKFITQPLLGLLDWGSDISSSASVMLILKLITRVLFVKTGCSEWRWG